MKWPLPAGKRRRVVICLIELLIVMAIVGILTGFVVPGVTGAGGAIAGKAVVEEATHVVQR